MENINASLMYELSTYVNYFLNNFIIQEEKIKIKIINNLEGMMFEEFEYSKEINKENYDINDFLKDTSRLNELNKNRKKLGVYYTPTDVSDFMALNALLQSCKIDSISSNPKGLYSLDDLNHNEEIKFNKSILEKKVLDPTCGNSEFLLSIIKMKLILLDNDIIRDDSLILEISKTLHGNDLNINSIIISKIRIYLYLLSKTKEEYLTLEFLDKLAETLDKNFTNENILLNEIFTDKFDIIIGNPPYVEANRYPIKLEKKYGNIYANILELSIELLVDRGILSFVLPISYVSTLRMRKIRDFVNEKSSKEKILNFSDRPDALFSDAHQKLSIVFIQKDANNLYNKELYTSNYIYWYKKERKNLFNKISLIKNPYQEQDFIPKLGTKLDLKIYKKIKANDKESIYEYINDVNKDDFIYLSMRGTFWIKSFLDKGISNEYKKISCFKKHKGYLYCIFNSSLFFWYWTVVSDCWHITNKEFKNFKLNLNLSDKDLKKFNELAGELEERLEQTKVYVGTKQTDYEYKHKEGKYIIDKIDNQLARIYKLSNDELNYIKNYAIKYREGRGSENGN